MLDRKVFVVAAMLGAALLPMSVTALQLGESKTDYPTRNTDDELPFMPPGHTNNQGETDLGDSDAVESQENNFYGDIKIVLDGDQADIVATSI